MNSCCRKTLLPPRGLCLPGLVLAGCLLLGAVQIEASTPAPTPQAENDAAANSPATTPEPPTPPIREDFEGQPQLSLFPRIGDYRPEADSERLPYWNSFIEHVQKASGVTRIEQNGAKGRAYSFRSIKSLDSIGFFSPIAVTPATSYRVKVRIKANLPEGATAGMGILEFDKFYWIGEQPPESFSKEHQRGLHEGVKISGEVDWREMTYPFITGPETGMIHLIFFREGEHARLPVLLDDIVVEMVE